MITNPTDTFAKLREILAEHLWIEQGTITPESNFRDDLGVDSLDAVELAMSVEANWNLSREIAEAEVIACEVVTDAVKLIDSIKINP